MTEKLTKRILVKLIKEEINKVLLEQTMDYAPGEIENEIRKTQGKINNWKKDLRYLRRLYIGGSGPRDQAPSGLARSLLNSYPYGTSALGQFSAYAEKMLKKQLDQMKDLQMALKKNPKQQSPSGPFGLGPGMTQSPKNFPGQLCPDGSAPIGTNPDGSPMCPGQSTPAPGSTPPGTPSGPAPTKKGKKGKRRSRRGKGPYFFRKYRKAGIDKAFAKEFGGTDKAAFDKFYDRVNMPEKSRDYQFGPGHYRKFTGIMGKDRANMPGTKASKSPMKSMGSFNQNLEQVVRKYMGPYKASITTGDMKRVARKAVSDLKRRTNNDPKVPSVADMEMVLRQAR